MSAAPFPRRAFSGRSRPPAHLVSGNLSGANARAATASSGKQCARSNTYGSQCIDVLGSRQRVTEIQTWFDDTGMFWPNDHWRIDLERYICDPIGKTKATCWAATTGQGRGDNGRISWIARASRCTLHSRDTTATGRRSLYRDVFRSDVWLCTEVAVYNAATHRWVYNAAGLAHGVRACVSVHR